MDKVWEVKNIAGSVVDVDKTSRRIVMNWSSTEEKDFDGDVISKSAYNKTIQERGPNGADLIYWLTDHEPSVKNIPGKITELSIVGKHLQATGTASDTTLGNDLLQLYLDGIIKQHSVGFVPQEAERRKDHRYISQIMLFEGSSVLWGANINTGTVSVGKSILSPQQCADELEVLMKSFRSGSYSDDMFGLLEIRIKQIQKSISELTRPPEDGTASGRSMETTKSDSETIKQLQELKQSLSWN